MSYICSVDDWITENFIKPYNLKNENKIQKYLSPSVCSKTMPYSILQIQPETSLKVDPQKGLKSIDDDYYLKFNYLFQKSLESKYDLVLTPEYSVPLKSINFLIKNLQDIKVGTLYCLGCEGVNNKEFEVFLQSLEDNNVIVNRDVFEDWDENQIVCCLLYLVKIRFFVDKGTKDEVFAFPQFKTKPMKDTQLIFETQSLSLGKKIFSFGQSNEIRMLSIICSDVFNYELIAEIKRIIEVKKTLVFHPQLNSKPQNDYFRLMHSIFINFAPKDYIRIISLNWAYKTNFIIDGEKKSAVQNSWSGVLSLYDEKEIEDYIKIVDREAKNGLNIAHNHHIIIYYLSSEEHVIDMNIRQLASSNVPTDIQNNILLNIKSVGKFNSSNYKIEAVTSLCDGMIDDFFRENLFFDCFFKCDNCKIKEKSDCSIGKLNTFMSLLLNGKLSNEFEIINDGKLTSLTSKHYKSEYSREKVYICKRVLNLLQNGKLSEKFKCAKQKIQFDVVENGLLSYNAKFTPEGYDPINIRIIYLKNANKNYAKKLFNDFYLSSIKYAENLIIYYENEHGTNVYPEDGDFDTSIVAGKITDNQASILGGR